MVATFESILPIFLLIVGGNLLRRLPIIDDAAWPGLEKLGYWFLYPALLFITILNADFSGLSLDAMLAALILGILLMGAITLASWPLLRAAGWASAAEYSSIFQTSVRWNGFMALAIAERIFPATGAAVVALVMAAIIVPVNVMSVAVVTRFADRNADWGHVAAAIARNPLILSALAALFVRALPWELYPPLNQTLNLVGRAALGMGLLTIGAGLRPADMLKARTAMWVPVFMKLAVFPVLLIGLGLVCGVGGEELRYLALCAAVPTAMNGFLLARQLGGDAELYAAVTTLQTVVAFFSIPAVLAVTGYIMSG